MRIDNVYNHLSTNLAPRKRNTTHKSSELKEVYNSMARYNKNSPLYLLSLSEAKQEHMINIKEAALTLRDVSESFADTDSALYAKKMLRSENDAVISGTFRSQDYSALPQELHIKISSLATEQINTGCYMRSNQSDIMPGSHSFSIETIAANSRFSVSVSSEDTNLDVQKKIMQYINNRNLGITASIITEGNESALMLSSNETGIPGTDDGLHFTVQNEGENETIADVLGMNHVSTRPANSEFYINDERHSSASNHISINQIIELDFHATSENPVAITFVPDTETAMHQIDLFVDAYNSLVDLSDVEEKTNVGVRNLFHDISGIVDNHKNELEASGLFVDDNNRIVKDEALLVQSVTSGEFAELFNDISSFREDIDAAAKRLTLDPMAYINKLMVTYPNTRNKFGASYTQSLYSGLMYNNYA